MTGRFGSPTISRPLHATFLDVIADIIDYCSVAESVIIMQIEMNRNGKQSLWQTNDETVRGESRFQNTLRAIGKYCLNAFGNHVFSFSLNVLRSEVLKFLKIQRDEFVRHCRICMGRAKASSNGHSAMPFAWRAWTFWAN